MPSAFSSRGTGYTSRNMNKGVRMFARPGNRIGTNHFSSQASCTQPGNQAGNSNFIITGQTLGTSAVPIPNCYVDLLRAGDNSWVATTRSDSSGYFSFMIPYNSGYFKVVGYLPGSGGPDLAGSSANIIVATGTSANIVP